MRVFAFGDVHGRADLIDRLLAAIGADLDAHPVDRAILIGLGDYVDRGSDSRGVIERLSGGLRPQLEGLFVKGNHEAMLLDFLDRPARGAGWIQMGGWECLASYGITARLEPAPSELTALRNELARALPPSHVGFLAGLRPSVTLGDYAFVHAGVRLGVPLGQQQERDLLWIRSGFADRDEPYEKIVVHGHTVVAQPFVGQYRINLDTGAYATGRLTCMVLEADQRRFLEMDA